MFEFEVPTVDSIQASPRRRTKRRFVLVAVPDGDPFDVIGPMAVIREANYFLESSGRPDLKYDYEVVTNQPGTVFEVDGLKMVVDKPCYEVRGNVDTVVFQAVDYEGECLEDERFLAWVRRISKRARRMATACIGTYVLAGSRPAGRSPSHDALVRVRGFSSPLSQRRSRWRPHLRQGRQCLHLCRHHVGAGPDGRARRGRTSAPSSPCASRRGLVMFLRRPASQSQFSVPLTALKTEDSRVREVISHVVEHPDADLTIERLSEFASMSPRNFVRVFSREIGMTPGKFVEMSRLETARSTSRAVHDARQPGRGRVRVRDLGRHAPGLRPQPGSDPEGVPRAFQFVHPYRPARGEWGQAMSAATRGDDDLGPGEPGRRKPTRLDSSP